MPVAGTVVGQHALLCCGLDVVEARRYRVDTVILIDARHRGRRLEDVEDGPGIAGADGDEVLARIGGQLHPTAEATLVGQGAIEDAAEVLVGQQLEAEHAQAREQRGVDLEVGVLGGGPDERDHALLDVRQQRVLLGLVEAVDLVDEEDGRATAALGPRHAPGHHRAHVLDATRGRREHLHGRLDRLRQQACQRRLAHARRSPQHHRDQPPALDHAPQCPALTDERLLPGELLEAARAHARGQRHMAGLGPHGQGLRARGSGRVSRGWGPSAESSAPRTTRRLPSRHRFQRTPTQPRPVTPTPTEETPVPPQNLRIPGPTPLPDAVREAGSRQMVGHRGPEFQELVVRVSEGMRPSFQTSSDVMILTSSGSGGLESAIVSFLSPGDPVLSVSIGNFGERFAKIARAYGADVTMIEFDWGQAADPDAVREAIRAMAAEGKAPRGRAGHLQRDLDRRHQPACASWPQPSVPRPPIRSSSSTASARSGPCPWRWTPGTSTSSSPAPRRPG